jgi:septum formation inhibitor-activating ATPase MinD
VSVNQGEPLVIADPKLSAARAMAELARQIAGVEARRSGFLKRKASK